MCFHLALALDLHLHYLYEKKRPRDSAVCSIGSFLQRCSFGLSSPIHMKKNIKEIRSFAGSGSFADKVAHMTPLSNLLFATPDILALHPKAFVDDTDLFSFTWPKYL